MLKTISSFALALIVSSAFSQTATMNGQVISSNVKFINGKPYVALEDIARSNGMRVVKKGNRYILVAAGGANEVKGRFTGKIGDDLFTGDWRFKVLSVQEAGQYNHVFGDAERVEPKGPGNKLVIVRCQLRNGHRVPEDMHFTNSFASNSHSALTDTDSHTYPIYDYDVHYTHYKWAAEVLPGATIDFALVFEVPGSAKPRDLVYSIFRYDDRGDSKKTTDVRIALHK
ncbi:MAG: hypothetical protein JSS72_03670 [Armatimonadetes bacterium]|nr:hypothetical protein [Armatimonadota bacterium]